MRTALVGVKYLGLDRVLFCSQEAPILGLRRGRNEVLIWGVSTDRGFRQGKDLDGRGGVSQDFNAAVGF